MNLKLKITFYFIKWIKLNKVPRKTIEVFIQICKESKFNDSLMSHHKFNESRLLTETGKNTHNTAAISKRREIKNPYTYIAPPLNLILWFQISWQPGKAFDRNCVKDPQKQVPFWNRREIKYPLHICRIAFEPRTLIKNLMTIG